MPTKNGNSPTDLHVSEDFSVENTPDTVPLSQDSRGHLPIQKETDGHVATPASIIQQLSNNNKSWDCNFLALNMDSIHSTSGSSNGSKDEHKLASGSGRRENPIDILQFSQDPVYISETLDEDEEDDGESMIPPSPEPSFGPRLGPASPTPQEIPDTEENPAFVTCTETMEQKSESMRLAVDIQRRITFSQDGSQQSMSSTPSEARQSIAGYARYQMSPDRSLKRSLLASSEEADSKKRREGSPAKSPFSIRSPMVGSLGVARGQSPVSPGSGKSYLLTRATPGTLFRERSHHAQHQQPPLVVSSVTASLLLSDQSHDLSFSPPLTSLQDQNRPADEDAGEEEDWHLQLSETQDSGIAIGQRPAEEVQKPTTLHLKEPSVSKDCKDKVSKAFGGDPRSGPLTNRVMQLMAEEQNSYSEKRTSTPLEEGSPGSSLRDFTKPRTQHPTNLHLSDASTITPTSTPPPVTSIFTIVNQQQMAASSLAKKQQEEVLANSSTISIFHLTSSSSGSSGNSLSLEESVSALNNPINNSSSFLSNNLSDLQISSNAQPSPGSLEPSTVRFDSGKQEETQKTPLVLSSEMRLEGSSKGDRPLVANVANNGSPQRKMTSTISKNLFSPEVGYGHSDTTSQKRPHSEEELGRNVRPLKDSSTQADTSFVEDRLNRNLENPETHQVSDRSIQTDSSYIQPSQRVTQKPSSMGEKSPCHACGYDTYVDNQSLETNPSRIENMSKKSPTDGNERTVFRDVVIRYKDVIGSNGNIIKSDFVKCLSFNVQESLPPHNHWYSLSSGELADVSNSNPSSKSTSTSSLNSTLPCGGGGHLQQHESHPFYQHGEPQSLLDYRAHSTTSSSSCSVAMHDGKHDGLFRRPFAAQSTKITASSKVDPPIPTTSDMSPSNIESPVIKESPYHRRKNIRKKLKSPKKGSPRKASPQKAKELASCSSTSSPEIPVVARKKVAPILESIEVNESTGQLKIGTAVMARWKDSAFYSGDLIELDDSGRWEVLFQDGSKLWVQEEDIVEEARVTKGQSVLVTCSDGFCDPGIVQGRYMETDHWGFVVDLDTGTTVRAKRGDVVLSKDQAATLITKRTPEHPVASLSLDNIVVGKRQRTPKAFPDGSPSACGSARTVSAIKTRGGKAGSSRPDPNLESSDYTGEAIEDKPLSRIPRPKGSTSSKSRTEVDVYQFPDHDEKIKEPILPHKFMLGKTSPATPRSRGRPSKKGSLKKASPKKSPTRFSSGSLPTLRDLFEGLCFMISCADRTTQLPSMSSSSSSVEMDSFEIPKLERDHVRLQIEMGGGTVLDSFEETQMMLKTKVFLITNTYLRTLKYIKCLAANIRCISVDWVNSCCEQNQLLDVSEYVLPAGHSLIDDSVLEVKPNNGALKDLKILLVSETNPGFVTFWAPVLLAAQATTIYRTIESHNSGTVDVVVTDPSCPEPILSRSKELRIAVVSSEWVIQCIITGKKLPYNGHEKFKYTYVNT